MTISDLCNQVLIYIQSINIGNKSGTYTPSGSLANGSWIRTRSANVVHGTAKDVVETLSIQHIVYTNGSINSAYLSQATNDRIKNDWNSFKNTYISKMLNSNETISLSSILVFIYLVRCFIDARFMLFTDVYNQSYVWLYNTSSSVSYNVADVIPTTFTDTSGVNNLNSIISAFADEVSSRRQITILSAGITETRTVV